MKIIFFGTPAFSAEILKDLVEKGVKILAIVTQPDKVQGRHLKCQESAVKSVAKELLPDIPIFQPERISAESFLEVISHFEVDCFIVVAFGQIFPKSLLDMPPLGCINIHTSLLPKYRGAAPIQRVLMNGESETGVSIMYMVEKCDAGDVLAMKSLPISEDMNVEELTLELCALAKDLLFDTLLDLKKGRIKAEPQDSSKVTFAKKVNPEHAQIDWSHSARFHYNQYRGVTPKPGAWCNLWIRGKEVRLKLLKVLPVNFEGPPGKIIKYKQSDGLVVACAENALCLKELQIEGKKAVEATAFMLGYSQEELSFIRPVFSNS